MSVVVLFHERFFDWSVSNVISALGVQQETSAETAPVKKRPNKDVGPISSEVENQFARHRILFEQRQKEAEAKKEALQALLMEKAALIAKQAEDEEDEFILMMAVL